MQTGKIRDLRIYEQLHTVILIVSHSCLISKALPQCESNLMTSVGFTGCVWKWHSDLLAGCLCEVWCVEAHTHWQSLAPFVPYCSCAELFWMARSSWPLRYLTRQTGAAYPLLSANGLCFSALSHPKAPLSIISRRQLTMFLPAGETLPPRGVLPLMDREAVTLLTPNTTINKSQPHVSHTKRNKQ